MGKGRFYYSVNKKATILFVLVVAMGCRSRDASRETVIAASFYPVYLAAANVAAGVPGVKVVNMTGIHAGCLHDYQLTTGEVKMLAGAKAFVVNGGGMEPFLDKIAAQLPQLKIIDASKGLELLFDEHGEANPHLWVSITGAMGQVNNIARGLSEADPANANAYQKNAEKYIARLDSLRTQMHEGTRNIRSRSIITFHQAFPYLAKELNLEVAAVVQRKPGAAPSPQELTAVIELVRRKGIKALFAEPQYPAKDAEIIARETGARVYILDPVSTGPLDSLDYYIGAMERNLAAIRQALP